MSIKIALSGYVGWEITAEKVREQLNEANGADIEVTLSGPGGLVGEGLEIYNLFKNYPGAKTATMSGFVMSMMSYISTAFDHITAEDNAVYMLHNVNGWIGGDHNEILKYGEDTKNMSHLLARAYAKQAGKPLDEVKEMMNVTTYLFGGDIVTAGFADEVIEVEDDEDKDQATAMVRASLAIEACSRRMASEQSIVKDDLTRAAALFGQFTNIDKKAGSPARTGELTMDLAKLKKDYPELVAQLEADARKGMITAEAATTATATAVTAEQGRCMTLVSATVGEEVGKQLTAMAEANVSIEQMEAMGLSASGENGAGFGRQMLAAITAAASDGVGGNPAGTPKTAKAEINTSDIYANRQKAMAGNR